MKTDLVEIFQTIRAFIQPYSLEGFMVKANSDTIYELCTTKSVVLQGRRSTLQFVKLKINKAYVGLYFSPINADENIKKIINPSLLKLLKGQSSFHIKKLDDDLLDEIELMLKAGYTLYKQNQWL